MCWQYGEVRDPEKETHPDIVPFSELPESERQKDAIFLACCVVGRAAMTQLAAAEARVKELEQGFREVLVCARNISEGYYEDAALLGRIARSFVGAHKTCTQHKHGR